MLRVTGIRVTIPPAGISALNRPGGAVYMGMDRNGRRLRDDAVNEITRMGAVDSGKLRQSIVWEVVSLGARGVTARVGSDLSKVDPRGAKVDYPYIVHKGRGPVRPRRARVLRFSPKGSSAVIFRPRVGPAAPKPYLTNALDRFRFQ